MNFLNEALRETEPKPFIRLTLLSTHLDKTARPDKVPKKHGRNRR